MPEAPDRAALVALAERCEKAEGPDRELDLAICRIAANSKPLGHAAGLPDDAFKDCISSLMVPAYTASLDAALTLVPVGWRFSVDTLNRAGPLALCEPDRGAYVRGEAATPALALCAAALALCAAALRALAEPRP